jgi:hypothetical protein
MPVLTAQQIEQFSTEGYLLLPDVIPIPRLNALIGEFEAVVEHMAREQHHAGLVDELFELAPFETRLALLYQASRDPEPLWTAVHGKHHKTAGMFGVFTAPGLLDVVECLIGSEILAHPQFNSRAKLPNHEATVVPWHQDLGYLDPEADGTSMVNFWVPLVDTTMEMGGLQVIPGSHRWGLLPHQRIGGYLGIAGETLPPHQVVDCPVALGGVLMIRHKTVHRSIPNRSGKVRWSLDLRYSDPRMPTGRSWVAGFLARSGVEPERVAGSHQDWLRLLEGSAPA